MVEVASRGELNLFRDLTSIRWRQLDHNPIALLAEFTPERLEARANELVLHSRINQAFRRLKEYLATQNAWAATHTGVLGAKPVAYFSAEFGIHESVPIYSGGLGVLSGDHVKSASDLSVPFVAIGLYYDQGYFKQQLDVNGYQQEEYIDTKVENLPMRPAVDMHGKPITVSIDTRAGQLLAKVWLMRVGRVKLYLLDCDVEGNRPEDRELTSRLYGGDHRTRIRQELVLGVGGVRALRALGITPGVFHLNEGHSSFAALEAIREMMETDGLSFDEAAPARRLRSGLSSPHMRPCPAGRSRFDGGLIEEHFGALPRYRLRHFISAVDGAGACRAAERGGNASALTRCSGVAFAPSQRSQRCTGTYRAACGPISGRGAWRKKSPSDISPTAFTCRSWLAWQMQQLYDRKFAVNWFLRMGEPEVWQDIHKVDPGELWEIHHTLKNLLLSFVRRRVSRQRRRRGETDESIETAHETYSIPNVLDHRLCADGSPTYKRADLILTDIDRFNDMTFRSGSADPDRLRRQGPSGRRAGQATDQEDFESAARRALCLARGVHRGLRYQRLPAHGARCGRMAEQPAPAARGLGHERAKGRAQWRFEPVGARRLVGRGVRRLERLRHRQGNQPRLGRSE